MSRVSTPTQPQQTGNATPSAQLPRERVAQRAYDKWMKRGCKHGFDQQDWNEAENELRQEMGNKTNTSGTSNYR